MKVYETEKLRNVAFLGNKGGGKTSLLDALLFATGSNTRIGKVSDGSSMADYDPSEIKRKETIVAKIIPCEWKGYKVNVLDTPGYADFVGEVYSSLVVTDFVLIVVDGEKGVDIPTKRFANFAVEANKPVAFFINRCDSDRVDIDEVLESIREQLNPKAVLIQAPIGKGPSFKGVADVLNMKAYMTENGKGKEVDVPADVQGKAKEYRTAILDAVAENDESLMEKYLGGAELTATEIKTGFVKGVATAQIAPVFIGSALNGVGTEAFLQMLCDWFPSPKDMPVVSGKNDAGQPETRSCTNGDPLSAFVFKATSDPGIGDVCFFRVWSGTVGHGDDVYNSTKRTSERMGHLFVMRGKNREEIDKVFAGDIACVAKLKSTGINDTLCAKAKSLTFDPIKFPEPMVSLAVFPKSKADSDKIGGGFSKLMAIDPTFKMHIDHEFNETIISGIGEIHLELQLERLKERYGVEVEIGKPRIPYRETVKKAVKVQGKYKKQSGGRGQYGDCWIELSPRPAGSGFEFTNSIFGGSIPSKYVPAIEKGVRDTMQKGTLAGYQVVDVRVDVYDGSYHDVDSSDMSFQIAGSMAFKLAEEQANPVLLEPIMNVEVTAPQSFMGDITSDISSRRGKVAGMESSGDVSIIKAQIPLAELYKYSTTLRSMTSGAASHTMSFDHYEQVPSHIAQKLVDEARKAKEAPIVEKK